MPFEKRMDKYRKYQFLPQHLEARPPAPCPRAPRPRQLLLQRTSTALLTASIVRQR